MRARVSKATMKRLARVEQTRNVLRCVGGWGPILPHDEWEALAVAAQEKLIADTRGYLDDRYPDEECDGADPMDVSHRYKPGAAPYHPSGAARGLAR